ncbi:MAG: ribonuclease P protein component [Candidatus Nomurabacteria bacterium]|nr:ribonuclease P protein component [Candidatus Nomurabacteria bacterium]
MLPKKNRADRKTVEKIFKEGRFINSANLSFKFLLNKNASVSQISFITPKTVSKKAVVRNLLRRRGYAVLRKYFLILPKGLNGVILFGKNSEGVFGGRKNNSYNPIINLENEIKIILNKIN